MNRQIIRKPDRIYGMRYLHGQRDGSYEREELTKVRDQLENAKSYAYLVPRVSWKIASSLCACRQAENTLEKLIAKENTP